MLYLTEQRVIVCLTEQNGTDTIKLTKSHSPPAFGHPIQSTPKLNDRICINELETFLQVTECHT